MNARKIIAAGHICLDITPVFPQGRSGSPGDILIPGKLIHVNAADVHTGGSVANTGLALKILGNNVELLGKIGNDSFGSIIQEIVSRYHTGGLLADDSCSTSYSVVIAVPGSDRIFLHNPGANDSFSCRDIPPEALEGAALFHFGYPPLMRSMFERGGEELVTLFSMVRSRGIVTSLDFSEIDPHSEAGAVDWVSLLASVLPLTDFFLPSFEELCFMLDREKYEQMSCSGRNMTEHLDMQKDVAPLADRLFALGARAVMIKCGVSGLYYRTGDVSNVCSLLGLNPAEWNFRSGCQPCFPVAQVLSATGSGDTCIAAFLTGLLRGKPPEECVALAAAEGACCVTAYDALSGLKSIEELEKMIADHQR